jgi:hypothetical protein
MLRIVWMFRGVEEFLLQPRAYLIGLDRTNRAYNPVGCHLREF